MFHNWNSVSKMKYLYRTSAYHFHVEDVNILEQLFDSKIVAIIKIFTQSEDSQFYLREISKKTSISPSTTYRILKRLVTLNILKLEENKNNKLYKLAKNKNSKYLKKILKTEKRIVDAFIDAVKVHKGIEEIIMHGKEKKDRADVFIIGKGIDANAIKILSAEIKEKYGFMLSTLTFTKEQFEQMSAMGLFPREKKTIYKR